MLLVIMTNSLIRLDNTVRVSLILGLTVMMRLKLVVIFIIEINIIFSDEVHDEERNESDTRTDANDDGITKGYN